MQGLNCVALATGCVAAETRQETFREVEPRLRAASCDSALMLSELSRIFAIVCRKSSLQPLSIKIFEFL